MPTICIRHTPIHTLTILTLHMRMLMAIPRISISPCPHIRMQDSIRTTNTGLLLSIAETESFFNAPTQLVNDFYALAFQYLDRSLDQLNNRINI